jgi:hypothetical protein
MRINNCGGADLLPLPEAAKRLGTSPWTLRAHQKVGTIHIVRLGARVMVPCDELLRIVTNGLPSLKKPKKFSTINPE